MTPEQLTFDLPFRSAMEREDFLVSPTNQEAVDFIDQWPDWPGSVVCLVGPSGSGKTHLAQVWRSVSDALVLDARTLSDEAIGAVTKGCAIVLEDVDKGVDEVKLFHLFNAVNRETAFLLMTGRSAPSKWNIALADLKSRLATVHVVEMQLPDDQLLASLLVKQFQDRQIQVRPDLIQYLMPRIERSFDGIKRMVERLDKAALEKKSKISIAFAREVIKDS